MSNFDLPAFRSFSEFVEVWYSEATQVNLDKIAIREGRGRALVGRSLMVRCAMAGEAVGYEFTQEENKTFARLVRNMWRSGAVVVVASLILLAYHFIDFFGVSIGASASPVVTYVDYAIWAVMALLGVVTGMLLIKATAAFSALITTEGNDVGHLMRGMSRLADIFGLLFWTAVVGALLLGVSFVLLLTYA